MEFFVVLVTFLAALVCILTALFFYNGFRYVPFVPSKKRIVKKMVKAAGLKPGMKVVDLGCGDARFLIEAIREEGDIIAEGYEISWPVMILAKLNLFLSSKKAKIHHQNFFNASIEDADVVFCYLFPKTMLKLKEKFSSELKKGTVIVSYCFKIPGWIPEETITTIKSKPNNFLILKYRVR